MKSQFATFASRLVKSLFAASLCALIISPHATSQPTDPYNNGGSDDNTVNHNPDPAPCCSCIGMLVHGIVDEAEAGIKRVKPDENGGYRALVTPLLIPKAPAGTKCDDQYTVTVTATLWSKTGVVDTQAKSTIAPGGTLLFKLPAHIARRGDEWRFQIACGGSGSDTTEGTLPEAELLNQTEGCNSITLSLGGCESCAGGQCSLTGEPDSSMASFTATIPTTRSAGGMAEGTLDFYTASFSNPGPSALLANVPASFAVNRDPQGVISSVGTGAATLTVAPAAAPLLAQDPNAFTVTHKDPSNATFRTTTISFVEDGGTNRLRMDSAFDGAITRHEQTRPQPDTLILEKGRLNGTTFEPLWQETLVTDQSTPGTRIRRRTIKERPTSAAAWQTVSDIETTWERQIRGWVKTKEIIDPSPGGAQLTSNWEYYQPGEPTGPDAATAGLGRLKHHARYDGYESLHTYTINESTVTTPHAGNLFGKVETFTWDPVTLTETSATAVNGTTIARSSVTHSETSTTSVVHTSEGQTLTTTTHYKPSDADFGGKPVRIIHPDGTLTTYAYTRDAGGGHTTVMTRGATSDQTTVSRGKQTTTVTNSRGTTILSQTTAIGYGDADGEIFDSMAVTQVDALGRPEITAYFPETASLSGEQATVTNPAWTTTTEYSCCGVAKEIDMYGIPTFHAYDHLQRHIKTNRLGVTTETHHLGLTTETHRYPELVAGALSSALAGTSTNLISRSVTNLSGTLQESWSPDPTSTTAGTLIKSSSTVTTYQPAAGLSTRSVTTVPGNHSQTTDSFLDGRTAATYGDLSPAMEYKYAANATGELSTQAYLVGGDHYEVTGTQSDWAGRTLQSGHLSSLLSSVFESSVSMHYNSEGQLVRTVDPDNVTTLNAYNAQGERVITAIDLNANDVIDYGTDTVSYSQTDPALDADENPVWLTISKVWQDDDTNPAFGTVVSTSTRSPDGLFSRSQSIGVGNPSTSVTELGTEGNWTTTSTNPDNSYTVTTYLDGLMDISENFASDNTLISSTSMRDASNNPLSGYDDLNRPIHQRDSRTGVTTTNYLSATADIVKSVTDPGNRSTSFTYDIRGRRTHVDAPDTVDANNNNLTNITITHYFPDGNVQETTGDQTYRTTHTYDYADRQLTLTTYGTATATTTWTYSPDRGFLTRKAYEDGNGTDYTYTNAGRLETRTWQRGVITTYGYDDGGRLETVDYTNETNGHTTPNLVNSYDALGRLRTVTRGGVLHAETTYRPGDLQRHLDRQQIDTLNQAVTYTYQDGTNGTLTGRPNGYTFTDGTAVWGFDNAGRLAAVTDTTDTFNYGYRYTPDGTIHRGVLPSEAGTQSHMPFSIVGPQVETTLAYENTRNALAYRQNEIPSGPLSKFSYTVNDIGQRDSLTPTGSAFSINTPFSWGYNQRGELTTANRPGNTAFERAYSYDGIGNRLSATDHTGSATNYFADTGATTPGGNALNQYAKINYPSSNTIEPQHDTDGNMETGPVPGVNGLSPGVPIPANATLTWDAENRLVKAVLTSTTVEYVYDHQSRLISRTVGSITTRYLYDGWNRIAEYESNGTGHTLKRSYLWGMDLSGSMQGAGGVGGLLSMTVHDTTSATFYPTYDGNGNVSEYVDENGDEAAHFEYDPFGNLTVDSEGNAEDFPYRFSTKPQDLTTGLYYYGYRWYDPLTGKWPSRDPIEERGGVNLYAFVENDGSNAIDRLGMKLKKYSGPALRDDRPLPDKDGMVQGGQTEANWISVLIKKPVKVGRCWKVPMEDKFTITIRINTTSGSTNFIDNFGYGPLEHEKVHEKIHKGWYNQVVDLVNPIADWSFKSEKCAILGRSWADAVVRYFIALSMAENRNFDNLAYDAGYNTSEVLDAAQTVLKQANGFRDQLNRQKCGN